ncbi:amidase [Aphelenchoides avenae]|nr:amidase [Aphelenchus avenae]
MAYSWNALQVQETLNPIFEYFIEAFDQARSLDEQFGGKSGKPPLYGIPFSVKNYFYMKGYDCSLGFTKFINKPKNEECTFITLLKNLGAIPFLYAAVPQGMLNFACSSPLYGTTRNPHDPERACGGSSSGDAVLVASGAAPFGTATDIGGSGRIPAAFCGIVGLKPTLARLPAKNYEELVPGFTRLANSLGFFTKTVEEHVFLWQTVLAADDYRRLCPRQVPLPLKMDEVSADKKPLRIGYFVNDGFVPATPGPARVVLETVEKLELEGHELVKFDVPSPAAAADTFFRAFMPDNGAYALSRFKGEAVDPYTKELIMAFKIPMWLRSGAALVLDRFSPQLAIAVRAYNGNVSDVRKSNELMDAYRNEFEKYWASLNIDALICPAFTVPAVPNEYPAKIAACGLSTGLFNMLDYPAGVVPTGTVLPEDDEALQDENKYPIGSNPLQKMIRKAAANSKGLPLAVQVVAPPYDEETCLRVMTAIEKFWT